MTTPPMSTTAALARVRAWRTAKGWAPYRYANEAGLGEATLRGMDTDGWNPTVRTLEKLEALIPDGWMPGHPVPPDLQAVQSEGRAA